jgi:mRNA interferase RelE/StbE
VRVEFRKSFEKDLGKIRDRDLLLKIKTIIEEVESINNLSAINNLKKLKGEGNYYRIRVGDYRVGFTETEGIVTFIRVLHRKEMYRYFP